MFDNQAVKKNKEIKACEKWRWFKQDSCFIGTITCILEHNTTTQQLKRKWWLIIYIEPLNIQWEFFCFTFTFNFSLKVHEIYNDDVYECLLWLKEKCISPVMSLSAGGQQFKTRGPRATSLTWATKDIINK